MFDTLIKRMEQLANTNPEKMAVAFKKERLDYGSLYERITVIGSVLSDMGIRSGDRILFTAVSKPETVAVYLGIQYCGGIAVFIDKNASTESVWNIYQDASAVLLLTDKPMKEYVDKMRIYSLRQLYLSERPTRNIGYVIPEEDDIAELLFTTGTTGTPKGVILTYRAVYHILSNTIRGIGMTSKECILIPLPLNHSFALRVLRAALYQGSTVILQNGFVFAKEIENNQTEFHCTAMAAVPASMEILRNLMPDRFVDIMGKFRYIEISAGSLTVEQRKRLTAQLPNTIIYNTWGSSETGGALFVNVSEIAQDPKSVSTIGKPLPGIEVGVLGENGEFLSCSDASHPGRMALKGEMQMAGYWNREELMKETLKDGWLITSDLVYMDERGYVYMLGRADDIINVGGEKVSPVEVENVAGQCPMVRECACIGVDDPEGITGQIPVLFAVSKGTGLSEDVLRKFFVDKLERYKFPRKIILLPELPRNSMGKIDRKKLHVVWENRDVTSSAMNPVIQAILTRRSIRKFTDQPIPRELLDIILQAGYYAPTGHNMQTWRFTVLQNQEKIMSLKGVIKKITVDKRIPFYGFENPQCLILISNDRRNPDGCQDCSCAAENIFLAAHSLGLGAVWLNPLMKICDEPDIRSILTSYGIPGNHTVWCMAALGYPLGEGVLLAKKKNVVAFVG